LKVKLYFDMATILASKNCNHPTCQGQCRRKKADKPARQPIARRSKKRAKQERQYLKARELYLKAHPDCQAMLEVAGCSKVATTIHHPGGRIGDDLTDPLNMIGACMECHTWIETHPKEAKAMGLSISRLQVTEKDSTIYAPEEQAA
jgi:hypothetical protein